MWMISLIPLGVLHWIINIALIAGVTGVCAAWIGKWIPFYGQYAAILKPIGILLLCVGLFFKGGYTTEEAWRAKIADLESKVKVSEEKSKEANIALDKSIKEKTNAIKQAEAAIKDRIKKDAAKIDAECKVAPEAIKDLNDAAKNVGGKKK